MAVETTLSEEAILAALKWLQTCDDNHVRRIVGSRSNPTYHPTCLLDLREPSCESKNLVRLVDTGSETVSGVYASLSHPWGDSQHLQLLGEITLTYKKAISFDHMPRNFQDEIRGARPLGIHCPWIDSLCIIRDDYEDRLRESRRNAPSLLAFFPQIICN